MTIKVPEIPLRLMSRLEQSGFAAYLVGGCVRDSLLGRQPGDWDIATNALPEQVMTCFDGFHVIPTGLQHGTATVMVDHKPFEITTFRVDGQYLDHRRPERVTFVDNLREDLARRDFTINAMAYHPQTGLVDYFHGKEDLAKGCIACVGDARQRFAEDALRILRAVRFSSVLNFDIAADTAQAAKDCAPLLERIAVERIRVELDKALMGDGVEQAFRAHADIIIKVIPELGPCIHVPQNNARHHLGVWDHTLRSVSLAPKEPVVRLTMLLHDCAKPTCLTVDDKGIYHFRGHGPAGSELAGRILRRLRYDNRTIHSVTLLVRYHDADIQPTAPSVKSWLRLLGEVDLRRLLMVKRADRGAHAEHYAVTSIAKLEPIEQVLERVLSEGQCYRLNDLAVDGKDLMEAGISQGKHMGETLEALLDLVVEETLPNEREALLREARKHYENLTKGGHNETT